MHCDRRDIIRWRKAKRLKKQSQNADSARKSKNKIVIIQKPILNNDKKVIRVIKKDGTVIEVIKE